MSEKSGCPWCKEGQLVKREGRLDQSRDAYLPTTVWSCARCGYVRYDAAQDVHWRIEQVRKAA
jgi:ribosomal protein L37AE/L43A